jgi:hypothetical protein
MQTQGWALDVQMSSIGRKSLGSSRVVNLMDMTSGAASPLVNNGLPQVEQKVRVAKAPLEARTEWEAGEPVTTTALVETITPEANGAPLERWQSRQWQLSMARGALEHV